MILACLFLFKLLPIWEVSEIPDSQFNPQRALGLFNTSRVWLNARLCLYSILSPTSFLCLKDLHSSSFYLSIRFFHSNFIKILETQCTNLCTGGMGPGQPGGRGCGKLPAGPTQDWGGARIGVGPAWRRSHRQLAGSGGKLCCVI
uniref:Uncharacterized protein n=1 Tax=Pipistrellus kuhlii TaxID=59472 RepID=A0A7J8B2E4_PIPKU|nr:hypothetical protein mPipKuh1_007824 [Pipistrellus kuhlii]